MSASAPCCRHLAAIARTGSFLGHHPACVALRRWLDIVRSQLLNRLQALGWRLVDPHARELVLQRGESRLVVPPRLEEAGAPVVQVLAALCVLPLLPEGVASTLEQGGDGRGAPRPSSEGQG